LNDILQLQQKPPWDRITGCSIKIKVPNCFGTFLSSFFLKLVYLFFEEPFAAAFLGAAFEAAFLGAAFLAAFLGAAFLAAFFAVAMFLEFNC
jgi:hypothetical protein